jgi:hypothetical protein
LRLGPEPATISLREGDLQKVAFVFSSVGEGLEDLTVRFYWRYFKTPEFWWGALFYNAIMTAALVIETVWPLGRKG